LIEEDEVRKEEAEEKGSTQGIKESENVRQSQVKKFSWMFSSSSFSPCSDGDPGQGK